MAREENSKSSGKSSKTTTKTARVLGLLTSPSGDGTEPAPRSTSTAERPAPSHRANDTVVENQVKSALASELETVLANDFDTAPEPAPEPPSLFDLAPETAPKPEPAFEPLLAPESDSEPTFTPAPEPTITPVPERRTQPDPAEDPKDPKDPADAADPAQEKVPAELEDAVGPKSKLEPEIYCFNVMQALVEQKVDKYIELFGLCKCARCRIDVIALALSNLPAKYVVARKHEMIPMLSVCEGKYNAAIVSQVMNACKQVMEHPRHKLKN